MVQLSVFVLKFLVYKGTSQVGLGAPLLQYDPISNVLIFISGHTELTESDLQHKHFWRIHFR